MLLYHQNFVLQLYLYGCILVCISAHFVLRIMVLKNVCFYDKHENTLILLGTLASFVICNKFKGTRFGLCYFYSCLLTYIWAYVLFLYFSCLSFNSQFFTDSGHICCFIQISVNILLCSSEQVSSGSAK